MKRTPSPNCARMLAVALSAALVLAACGDGREDSVPTATAGVELAATATGPPGEPQANTPTPTFRPTELAPTPAELDREFADPEDMQRRRAELFQTHIEPVVEDDAVQAAMVAVPRHAFVPTQYLSQAYNDHPLPIGYGQTISQPSLVAIMTEMLDLEPGDTVLEIGTGSGYQSAVLSRLARRVTTIERFRTLARQAERHWTALGLRNVSGVVGDGTLGWKLQAPFDRIVVTAACAAPPARLLAQLGDGGLLIAPVGPAEGPQRLTLFERDGEAFEARDLGPAEFLPLVQGVALAL